MNGAGEPARAAAALRFERGLHRVSFYENARARVFVSGDRLERCFGNCYALCRNVIWGKGARIISVWIYFGVGGVG